MEEESLKEMCLFKRRRVWGTFLEPSPPNTGCRADGDRLRAAEHKDEYIAAGDTAMSENNFTMTVIQHWEAKELAPWMCSKLRGV